jgi:hypothetical protein
MGWSHRDLPRLSHPKAAAIELKCTSALATAENAGIVHTIFQAAVSGRKTNATDEF